MDKKINIGELISIGWNSTLKNFPYLLGLMGIVVGANIVFGIGSEFFKKAGFFPLLGYNILIAAIGIVIGLGLKKITISLIDGKKEAYSALYSHYNLIIRYFVANLLYSLIVALPIAIPLCLWLGSKFASSIFGKTPIATLNIAFILLGLAGLVFSILLYLKFMFFSYYIVDKNSDIIESLKLSNEVTKGEKMSLFLLSLILGLVNIAGALALGIGLLITIPLTMLAMAAAYRRLSPINQSIQ